jgi:endonuclease YncB( thermonuclease family)
MTAPTPYCYNIVPGTVRVIDGDTFEADIDLGFHLIKRKIKIRILDINCPERRTESGKQATAYATGWLDTGKGVTIQTVKTDSFGRWLAHVTSECGDNLATDLLSRDLADPFTP